MHNEHNRELLARVIKSINDDVSSGEETEPAWIVAERDAWQAFHRWLRVPQSDLQAATAATASILLAAADLLWLEHLIEWCDEYVVPGLSAYEREEYAADCRHLRGSPVDLDAATWILGNWAHISGSALPVRA